MENLDPGTMRITVQGSSVKVIVFNDRGDEMEALMDPATGLLAAQAFMACSARARANEIAGDTE